MRNSKKASLIFFALVLVLPLLAGVCAAQDKGLEIQYPVVPGAETPTTVKTPLPQYVRYIFNFSIWIAGFIAFIALIYGGVRYLTSAGNPSTMEDAKDQMFAGILGLLILLSSYLILANLNPQLVVLKAELGPLGPAGETIGVYLCRDSSKQNCMVYGTDSDSLPADIDDQVGYIYFQNSADATFGAVLHEDRSKEGTCEVYLSEGSVQLPSGSPSSVTVFQRGTPSGEGVTLYECKDYKVEGNKCKKWGPYSSASHDVNEKGRSIKIVDEGKYLAVVAKGTGGTDRCEVFQISDPDLASNYIGICGGMSNMGCFGSITVIPIE